MVLSVLIFLWWKFIVGKYHFFSLKDTIDFKGGIFQRFRSTLKKQHNIRIDIQPRRSAKVNLGIRFRALCLASPPVRCL